MAESVSRKPHPDCVEYVLEDGRRFAWSESNVQYEEVPPDGASFTVLRARLDRVNETLGELWSLHEQDHEPDGDWCSADHVSWPCPTAELLAEYGGLFAALQGDADAPVGDRSAWPAGHRFLPPPHRDGQFVSSALCSCGQWQWDGETTFQAQSAAASLDWEKHVRSLSGDADAPVGGLRRFLELRPHGTVGPDKVPWFIHCGISHAEGAKCVVCDALAAATSSADAGAGGLAVETLRHAIRNVQRRNNRPVREWDAELVVEEAARLQAADEGGATPPAPTETEQ